jgi:hypothetical protein
MVTLRCMMRVVSRRGLRASTEVAAAEWIKPRLRGFASGIAAVVPDRFAAYARVLHPVLDGRDGQASWAEVAAWSGRTMHSLAQFDAISRPAANESAESWDGEPERGSLPLGQLRVLCTILAAHTQSADSCWFCLWDGWGQLHPGSSSRMVVLPDNPLWRAWGRLYLLYKNRLSRPILPRAVMNGPRVSLPAREYLLFQGPLAAAPAFSERIGGGFSPQSPNLFWPHDQAWCVASEIDLLCTLVAGSEELVEAILTDSRLEAWRVSPDDPISHDSDLINT